MMLNAWLPIVVGLMLGIISITYFVWGIVGVIRSWQDSGPPKWPLSWEWALAGMFLCDGLVYGILTGSTILTPDPSMELWALVLIGLFSLFTAIAFKRWLFREFT